MDSVDFMLWTIAVVTAGCGAMFLVALALEIRAYYFGGKR